MPTKSYAARYPDKTEVVVLGDPRREQHHHHYHYHKHGHSYDYPLRNDPGYNHGHSIDLLHNHNYGLNYNKIAGNKQIRFNKNKFGRLNNLFAANKKSRPLASGRLRHQPKDYYYHHHERKIQDYDYNDGLEYFATNQQIHEVRTEHGIDKSSQTRDSYSVSSSAQHSYEDDYENNSFHSSVDNKNRNVGSYSIDRIHNTEFDDESSKHQKTSPQESETNDLNNEKKVLNNLNLVPFNGLKLSFGEM
ncbi:hypothetical protein TNIN_274121 [Trichonephila inaurata madagascariensis]|uniref:Uncharacterized protein n=1 Tax=Trichonephila inaurata madagascariensis TaxID=2747483 RepID=A0A8X6XB67_9ARAC|nr:hypothetical protein TNIN_274121 [Trichonephila inaurata madagascariensis]